MSRATGARSVAVSLLAALTTWLTMVTWSGFSDDPGGYLLPLAVACGVVALSGAVLRLTHLPRLLVLVVQIAAAGLFLNLHLAGDVSLLGFLPTPDSIRACFDAVDAAITASQSYAAPVPANVTEFPALLIVVGTAVALVVDFLACGLRSVPIAGLPLLAIYTAPLSLLDRGLPWWTFALVAASFLALLAVDESGRVVQWGRDVTEPDDQRATPGLRRSGLVMLPAAGRIGLTATSLAVVIPVMIPTIDGGFLPGGVGGGGTGDGVRIVDPLVDLKRDLDRGRDVPLLVVETDDPRPDYFRTAVLDDFDGNSWRASDREIPSTQRANGTLPVPVGLTRAIPFTQHTYQVRATGEFQSQWLAAPYPATRADVNGDWRYDTTTMDILSAEQGVNTAGRTWQLTALDVQPEAQQFRRSGPAPGSIQRRFTEVDGTVPAWVGELAEEVTAEGENDAERAKLLQDWFALPHPVSERAEDPSFTYDLERAERGSGVDDLDDFLRNTRTGYCEQFAAAMALMARELQIPARVVVGFLKPDRVPGSDSWVFSSHDLHAWPELYFEGIGWVVFEPTPSSRQGATAPSYTDALAPLDRPEPAPTAPNETPTAGPSQDPTGPDRLPDEEIVAPGTESDSGLPPWAYGLAGLPVLAGLACVPRLARALVRRRRWETAVTPDELAEAAWAELRDTMRDLRRPLDDRRTLRHQVGAVTEGFHRRRGPDEAHRSATIPGNPDAEAALGRILTVVERSRYARTTPGAEAIRDDVDACVDALRLGVEPAVRRRADWLPVSLTSSLRRTSTRKLPTVTALDG